MRRRHSSRVLRALLRILFAASGTLLPGAALADTTVPRPPSGLYVSQVGVHSYRLEWVNPAENTDGSSLTDFGGTRVYRDGVHLVSLSRSRTAAGQLDSYEDSLVPAGSTYQLAAYDRSSPPNLSSLTPPVSPQPADDPDIEVSPDSLHFMTLGELTALGVLDVSNLGGLLEFEIVSDVPWLTADPPGGRLGYGEAVDIRVAADGRMEAGNHHGALRIWSNDPVDSLVVVPVVFDLQPARPPTLRVQDTLHVSLPRFTVERETLSVANDGSESLAFQLSTVVSWLSTSPDSGAAAPLSQVPVEVTVNAGNLVEGRYLAGIDVASNDPDRPIAAVAVIVEVLPAPPPSISVGTGHLEFFARPENVVSTSFDVLNRGSGPLQVMLSNSQPWLDPSPSAGDVPPNGRLTINASASSEGLVPGVYLDTLNVKSNDPERPEIPIPVRFVVSVEDVLIIDPPSLDVSLPCGSLPRDYDLTLTLLEGDYGIYFLDNGPGWTASSSGEGDLVRGYPHTITISVDPENLAPGVYSGTSNLFLYVGSFGDYIPIPINLTLEAPPDMVVSPGPIALRAVEGSPPFYLSWVIENQGCDDLTYAFQEALPWLSLQPSGGTVPGRQENFPIMTVRAESLEPGIHEGMVSLLSNDPDAGHVDIPVTLTVTERILEVVPTETAVSEGGFRCSDGDSTIQFLELAPIGQDRTFRSSLGLRAEDRYGSVRLDRTGLFSSKTDGETWPRTARWLLASQEFVAMTSLPADETLVLDLDPLGGVVTLYDTVPSYRILHRFAYGPAGGVNAPGPGHSLRLGGSGTLSETDFPDPTNFMGSTAQGVECVCPENVLRAGGYEMRTRAAVAETSAVDGYGGAGVGYDWPAGTFRAGGSRSGGDVRADDLFYVSGVPAGTPLAFLLTFRIGGDLSAYDDCYLFGSAGASGSLGQGGSTSSRSWWATNCGWPLGRGINSLLEVVARTRALETFPVSVYLGAGGGPEFGSGSAAGQLEVVGLPPGASLRSCQGFLLDGPTPVGLAVQSAEWRDGRIRVVWTGAERGALSVERRSDDEPWTVRALVWPGEDGSTTYEDDGPLQKPRYGYRLRTESGPMGEVWVAVPSFHGRMSVTASYDRQDAVIVATVRIPESGEATLEIFDVSGRRVGSRTLSLAGPGDHSVRLEARSLSSGIYFLKLAVGDAVGTTRVMILD